jgi:hypothetical protein
MESLADQGTVNDESLLREPGHSLFRCSPPNDSGFRTGQMTWEVVSPLCRRTRMVPRVSQSCRASPAFPDPIRVSEPTSKSESHVHRNVRDGQKPWPPKSALHQRQTFPESQLLTRNERRRPRNGRGINPAPRSSYLKLRSVQVGNAGQIRSAHSYQRCAH